MGGFRRTWVALTVLLWDHLVALYFAAMAWQLLTHPSVLLFYAGLLSVLAMIAYVLWRIRRARAIRESKASRATLNLEG